MSAIITFLIVQLATAMIGSKTFVRVEDCINRWNNKTIEELNVQLKGKDKKTAVLAEFEILGIELEGWLANLVIELAVAKTKNFIPKVE